MIRAICMRHALDTSWFWVVAVEVSLCARWFVWCTSPGRTADRCRIRGNRICGFIGSGRIIRLHLV